jgi:shikimate 5-dehydrogenase
MTPIDTYGLLGYPLGHSFSRPFFTEKFAKEGIPAEYLNFEIPDINLLTDVLLEHPNLRGFNVTIPYKEAILPLLDHISPEAQKVGAVNTVRVEWEGGNPILTGYNTDVVGFEQSLLPCLRAHHREALVLGTGGAAKAVMYVLKTVFGMQDRFLLMEPDEKEGRFLLNEIMQAGNFGHYDTRIKRIANESSVHVFYRRVKRNFRFLRSYPSEVLWTPLFKIWHFCWRLYKNR